MADVNEEVYVIPEIDTKGLEKEFPLSKPGFGAGGKTNEWRLLRPVINYEKCIKCLICWIDCPEATITRGKDNSVAINYDYCKGCGVCANECPTKAIEMVKED